jgi:hypothetical protein
MWAHRLVGGIMKDAVEMGSVAPIYIPSFINIVSGFQVFTGGYRNTKRMKIA